MKGFKSIIPKPVSSFASKKWIPFQFEDPLNLKSRLSSEEIMIMESARDYA
jgi:hypothetical protein